jgi:hypothetical protein
MMDRTLPGQGRSRGTVFSVDEGTSFRPSLFNISCTQHPTCAWDSFVTYRNSSGVWAHDFGTTGECLRPFQMNATSISSQNGTMTYKIDQNQELTTREGPNVTFQGLPYPLCSPPKADPTYFFTVYAGAQIILPNGTHLVTGMYTGCPPPGYVRNNGIHLFRHDALVVFEQKFAFEESCWDCHRGWG